MKKIISFFCLLIILFSCGNRRATTFANVAIEYTKKCPVRIADDIVCDSMKYDAIKNINSYYYVLTGELDNPIKILFNKLALEAALIGQVRNSVEMKDYKDFNTTLCYIYMSSSTHKELFRVSITPRQYK